MILSVYTISRKPVPWNYRLSARYHNLAEDTEAPEVERYYHAYKNQDWYSSLKYITYLADKRNRAVTILLKQFPETTHIMCSDHYYHGQTDALSRLIGDFYKTDGRLILGGAIWGKVRSKVSHILRPDVTWFDKWAVPELRFMPHGWDPQKDYVAFRVQVPVKGFFRTHSVPGVHIFPRSVWDEGHRYGVVEDLHGCEQTPLCENSGLPCYVDFNANFYREKIYSNTALHTKQPASRKNTTTADE